MSRNVWYTQKRSGIKKYKIKKIYSKEKMKGRARVLSSFQFEGRIGFVEYIEFSRFKR